MVWEFKPSLTWRNIFGKTGWWWVWEVECHGGWRLRKCKECYRATCWDPAQHQAPEKCGLCGYPETTSWPRIKTVTLPRRYTTRTGRGIRARPKVNAVLMDVTPFDVDDQNEEDPLLEERDDERIW